MHTRYNSWNDNGSITRCHAILSVPTLCAASSTQIVQAAHILEAAWSRCWSPNACAQSGREQLEGLKETHRKEEEELMQLALDKVIGQVAHGIGPQRSDVSVLARLLPPQGSYPFDHIVSDLQHPCQNCNTCQ